MSFVLALLLSACDLRSLTELLADLQPPPAEAADAEAAGDEVGDDSESDDSESDAEAARERWINRNEHVGSLRKHSRVDKKRDRRPDRTDEAPSEDDDASAEEEQQPTEEEAEEQPERRRPRGDRNRDGGGSGSEGSGNEGASEDTAEQSGGLSNIEQQVFDLLNAERERAGLSPLRLDSELTQGARAWSQRMATEGFFDHDRSGNFAENIAYGYPSAQAVHEGWMNSEGHRNNRMNSRYTVYGIGVYQQGNTIYYTERFR